MVMDLRRCYAVAYRAWRAGREVSFGERGGDRTHDHLIKSLDVKDTAWITLIHRDTHKVLIYPVFSHAASFTSVHAIS